MDQTRRKLVTSGSAVLAGAVTIGGMSKAGATSPGPPGEEGSTTTFTWYCQDMEVLTRDGGLGDTRTGMGALEEGGHVYMTHTLTPIEVTDGSADRVEQHLFVVPDGQLMGTGSVVGGNGTFAVVGGTGRYRQAAGHYTAEFEDDLDDGVGPVTFSFVLKGAY